MASTLSDAVAKDEFASTARTDQDCRVARRPIREWTQTGVTQIRHSTLSLLAASVALASPAMAFDAGGFAFQQHQHQLLQQQTAPNNIAGDPQQPADDRAAQVQALKAQYMEQLRPEYERRVQRDGLSAANKWLSQEAYRLGQKAAEMVQ